MSNREIDASNLTDLTPGVEYSFIIEKAEVTPNSSNTGEVAKVYANEKETNEQLNMYFNVFHNNPQAQSIGQKQFKKLLRSCGLNKCKLAEINETLSMKEFTATVKEDGDYLRVEKFISKDEAGEKAAAPKDDLKF